MQRNVNCFRAGILALVPILIVAACSPIPPTRPALPSRTPLQAAPSPTEPTAAVESTETPVPSGSSGSQFQADLSVLRFTAKIFKGGEAEAQVQQDQTANVQVNDRIEVVKLEGEEEQSYSTLNFPDFLKVELFSNAAVVIEDVRQETGGSTDVTLNLARGHMFVYLNDKTITQVTVETPYSTIKTLEDGTEFDVCHNEKLTCVLVKRGVAQVIGQGTKETLEAGEASYIFKDQPPVPAICAPLESFLLWEENYRQSAAAPALGAVVAELPPEPCAVQATDPSQLPSNANIVYQDDFKNLSTGWPQVDIDNYSTGYSGSEFYRIQILSPDDKYLVYVPNKKPFVDVNIDLKALTEEAQDGDFQYGVVFRRSGNRYYAFTISPRTKTWYVLKSSSNAVETLKEGAENSIQGLEAADVLRVAANGSTFFFYINGRLVGQVSDPDYTSGEVGLFVQTLDSPDALIHFDSLIVWDTQAPVLNPTPRARENCFNGKDDDGDGLIDKQDENCQRTDPTQTPEPPATDPPTATQPPATDPPTATEPPTQPPLP